MGKRSNRSVGRPTPCVVNKWADYSSTIGPNRVDRMSFGSILPIDISDQVSVGWYSGVDEMTLPQRNLVSPSATQQTKSNDTLRRQTVYLVRYNTMHLARRIPLDGMKEALTEKWTFLRRVYQALVAIFAFCTIYETYATTYLWLFDEQRNDYDYVFDLPMAATNVTVCSSSTYINRTFARSYLQLPERLMKQTRNISGFDLDEFIDAYLGVYLTTGTRLYQADPKYGKLLKALYRANEDLYVNYTTFIRNSLPSCDSMLSNCYFDGVPFDCCQKAFVTLGEDGVCIHIMLNFDVDDVDVRNPRTMVQQQLGLQAGLQFDVRQGEAPMPFEKDYDDGFLVYAEPVVMDIVSVPVTAPIGSRTFIDVKAARRKQRKNCSGWPARNKDMRYLSYYDGYGFSCFFDGYFKVVFENLNCIPPLENVWPEEERACRPHQMNIMRNLLSHGYEKEAQFNSAVKLTKAVLERMLVSSYHDRSRCRPRCDNWEYELSSSFYYLQSEDDHRSNFSRVSVSYSELSYRTISETQVMTMYLAFCNFGNVIGMYLGLSMAAIVKSTVIFASYFATEMNFPRLWWTNTEPLQQSTL